MNKLEEKLALLSEKKTGRVYELEGELAALKSKRKRLRKFETYSEAEIVSSRERDEIRRRHLEKERHYEFLDEEAVRRREESPDNNSSEDWGDFTTRT